MAGRNIELTKKLFRMIQCFIKIVQIYLKKILMFWIMHCFFKKDKEW